MKINRSSFLLDITVAGLFYLLAFAASLWFSHYHGNFYLINWLSLALVIAAFCFKRLRITKTKHYFFATWQIMAFQLALIATFIGICQVIGPISLQSLTHQELKLGIFPWATMILIAVVFRLISQKRADDTSFIDLIMLWLPIRHGSPLWSVCFLYLRQISVTILAFTLALITLGLLKNWQPLHADITLRQLLLSLIPIFILFYKRLNRRLQLFIKTQKWLPISLMLFSITLAIILSCAAYLLKGLAQPAKVPTLIQWFHRGFNPTNIVAFFNHGWWFAWSAMGGIFIAHRARHMTIQMMTIISLLVPGLLILLAHISLFSPTTHLPPQTIYIAIIGCLILCTLLCQKDVLPLFIVMYYPYQAKPRHRLFEIHLKRCLKTVLIMCFFAIPLGSSVITYLTCLVGLPLLMALPFIMLGLFKNNKGLS